MSKEYPEQLGAWVKRREASRRDHNLAAFLAASDDVRAAMGAGYAMKTIWANLFESQRIAFHYDAFLRYVHRYISGPNALSPQAIDGCRNVQQPVAAASAKVSNPGFTFNPVPNKEELL